MQTSENQGGGETLDVFYTNPAFLDAKNQCDLFDFHFDLNEDGTLQKAYYKDQVLDPNVGAGIFLVRHEYIKQKRKAESEYGKKIKAVEKKEEYKEMLQNQSKKQKEHRKQIDYKDRTLLLYRRILENLVLTENDKNEQKR